MAIHKLTDWEVRNATGERSDGGQLYLKVTPAGSRSWVFRWTVEGKRCRRGLGAYPGVSLALARATAAEWRQRLAEGGDIRERTKPAKAETFAEATAKLFELKQSALKGGGEAGRWMSTLNHHALSRPFAAKAVAEIVLADVVEIVRPVWERDVGRKLLNKIGQVMENARGRDARVLADVEKLAKAQLPQVRRRSVNHPALAWRDMPSLWASAGDDVKGLSFRFYLLNVPRVANVTRARWGEVDWEAGVWDIPPENMKSEEPFAAPLSRQSVDILREAKRRWGSSPDDYIFPDEDAYKHGRVSENAWGNWLKEGGWPSTCGKIAVPHGFRATFGTWCGDEEICSRVMQKRCIQHKVESPQDAAYLRSQLLRPRRDIMQAWADHVTSSEAERKARREEAERSRKRLAVLHPSRPGGDLDWTYADVLKWSRQTEPSYEPDLPSHQELERWARGDGID
ncbi:Integrase [Palleronia marisminoris]|uniref:Prophage CP4-57 integrase n=1 Tax=Palleronia marisminoris TaxID=315423 RepID=A0A1Y5SSD1_9RHOB|nr:site-specific integrase [Palleronia marisminoris]SFG96518.1 Integrase [Palleronia marisminoris]SLN47403.1 Prophage CP4-57 integrase [Palleronia marisminoris]